MFKLVFLEQMLKKLWWWKTKKRKVLWLMQTHCQLWMFGLKWCTSGLSIQSINSFWVKLQKSLRPKQCYSRVHISSDKAFSRFWRNHPQCRRWFSLRFFFEKVMQRALMWLNLYGHHAVRHKLIKGVVFTPFLSLCRTAWWPYSLSHINALCITFSKKSFNENHHGFHMR